MVPSATDQFEAFAGSLLDAVVLADGADRITYVNRSAEAMFGYTTEELVGQELTVLMPKRYHEAHRAGMQRIAAGGASRVARRALDFYALRKDGSEFPILLSITCWSGSNGITFSGIIQDQTDRKRLELREQTQLLLSRLIAESHTLMEAVTRVMETVCDSMAWEVGAMWIFDPRIDKLRCAHFWDARPLRRTGFEKVSMATQFARGEGLPGAVWQSGQALWIVDAPADPLFSRCAEAAEIGLHTCLTFPIIGPTDETIGALEFFTPDRRSTDPELLKMMETIGRQIGSLLERAHAAEAVLTIVEQMQVGVLVLQLENRTDDRSLRIISVNPAASQILDIPSDDLIGRLFDESFPNARAHRLPQAYHRVIETQQSIDLDDVVYGDARVARATFGVKAFPLPNNCVGVAFENISERKTAAQLLRAEREILERIAEGDFSVDQLLDAVASFSDEQTPGMYCSILRLIDEKRLECAAAPHLPQELAERLQTTELSDTHSPATLATTKRDTIVVNRIEDDERAESVRAAALAHNLQACWATPIITRGRRIVGTMVLFYDRERSPDVHELEVTEFASRLAAIIIDRNGASDASPGR